MTMLKSSSLVRSLARHRISIGLIDLGPSKHTCHMQVINNRDGTWKVNYIPTEVGETFIDIFLGDELVGGSPFKVNIFDISEIHVSTIDGGVVGHLVTFNIDASRAGVGQLEIVVQDGLLPCNAIPHDSFQFEASFLPNRPGRHTIDVKFNGLPVPGSQMKLTERGREKLTFAFAQVVPFPVRSLTCLV
jgi:filamin